MFWVTVLFKMCLENSSFQSVACLLILLKVSFTEQKFLIWMKSSWLIIIFMDHAFRVISKKTSPYPMLSFRNSIALHLKNMFHWFVNIYLYCFHLCCCMPFLHGGFGECATWGSLLVLGFIQHLGFLAIIKMKKMFDLPCKGARTPLEFLKCIVIT